ncbi:hypothetical protein Tco_0548973 [Tanacetum coccineum]
MIDMTALLNDLSYIPPNNEHNEPTQRDIGETSNEPTQATRNEFEELYVSANEELYPGYDYLTRLDFMAKFTYFKAKGRLTDSIFNEMLEFFQNVFPVSKGFKLPPSYYAIKKTFKTIGLGYESIHACEHDCCLFRGDNNKDLDFCPVVDILCELELIYPPALFDIMVHLVIHLPIEALEGGPIRLRWMYPFEIYMKKLKGYVRNKAKPEGSIAEGYVAEEALTFSSHYFRDVTTKFNRPDHNVDPPPLTCQFQVFRSS